MSQPTLYRIGTSYPPTPLHLLSTPVSIPMRSIPVKYPVVFTRGTGGTAGHGSPQTIWEFQYLTQEEVDVFLGILTVSSVLRQSRSGIYITTPSPEDHATFLDYTAIIHLPENLHDYKQAPGGYYSNLPFKFTHLAEYP